MSVLWSGLNLILNIYIFQLPPISIGNGILDLVVIGCGPAGLALAAESAKLGLNVGLIGPDLPFTNNYGVWEDEFRGTDFLQIKICSTIWDEFSCILYPMNFVYSSYYQRLYNANSIHKVKNSLHGLNLPKR